jgi:hypothetical protein
MHQQMSDQFKATTPHNTLAYPLQGYPEMTSVPKLLVPYYPWGGWGGGVETIAPPSLFASPPPAP